MKTQRIAKIILKNNEFKSIAKPLIKYLNDHHHPHTTIIITHRDAEVLEGTIAFATDEYLKD
jgi:hypothetical protein